MNLTNFFVNFFLISTFIIIKSNTLKAQICKTTQKKFTVLQTEEKNNTFLKRDLVIDKNHYLVWCTTKKPRTEKKRVPLYNIKNIKEENKTITLSLLVEYNKRKSYTLQLCPTCSKAKEVKTFLNELKESVESLKGKPITRTAKTEQHVLHFGDQGTGKIAALTTAQAMANFCSQKGNFCDYGLSSGDNIYTHGISIKEKGWEDTFHHMFTQIYQSLWHRTKIPIYLTLGNHDVNTIGPFNVKKAQEASKKNNSSFFRTKKIPLMLSQVSYSSAPKNPINSKGERQWNLLSYHYAKLINMNGVKTFLISLNTNTFPGSLSLSKNQTPNNQKQKEWLKEELNTQKAKTADWRIVLAHHPLYSIGRHGVNAYAASGLATSDRAEMLRLRRELMPIFCEQNVNFYLVGHDHHLQLDFIPCEKKKTGVVQVLSGAAAKASLGAGYEKLLNKIRNSVPAFSEQALTNPELAAHLIWFNGINKKAYLKTTPRPQIFKMLGFSSLQLRKQSALLNMIESKGEYEFQRIGCWKMKRTSSGDGISFKENLTECLK